MARRDPYYWLRMYPAFFVSDIYKEIMRRKDCDGAHVVLLYFWLCTLAVNKKGRLFGMAGSVMFPYDSERLSDMFGWYDNDEMANALSVMEQYGLIWKDESNVFCIAGYAEMVGKETNEAREKRARRSGSPLYSLPWEAPLDDGEGEPPDGPEDDSAYGCDNFVTLPVTDGVTERVTDGVTKRTNLSHQSREYREERYEKKEERGEMGGKLGISTVPGKNNIVPLPTKKQDGEEEVEGGPGEEGEKRTPVLQTGSQPSLPSLLENQDSQDGSPEQPVPEKTRRKGKSRKKTGTVVANDQPMHEGPPVKTFPCRESNGDLSTKQYLIYQDDIDRWKEEFPTLNIPDELDRMEAYMRDEEATNTSNRLCYDLSHLKTFQGLPRFIKNWFQRSLKWQNERKQDPTASKPVWQLEREEAWRRNHPDYSEEFDIEAAMQSTIDQFKARAEANRALQQQEQQKRKDKEKAKAKAEAEEPDGLAIPF